MAAREGKSTLIAAAFVILALAALAFLIVVLSGLEESSLSTEYIQSGCRAMGIHRPIKRLFRWFFPA